MRVAAMTEYGWPCAVCTLINPEGSSVCVLCGWVLGCAGLESPCNQNVSAGTLKLDASTACKDETVRAAIENIWHGQSIDVLLQLVGNITRHPLEQKFRGPIKKSNCQIRTAIVEPCGASEVMRAAGFEETESYFMMPENRDVEFLSRTFGYLREQAQRLSVRNKSGLKTPVKRRMQKYDEDLLREIRAERGYNEMLRGYGQGFSAASSSTFSPHSSGESVPMETCNTGVLRVRLRLPLGGRMELEVEVSTTARQFRKLISQRTGTIPRHLRLKFGFPRRSLEDVDTPLTELGIHDGEVIYLENVRDLFLGNLESCSFTMAQLVDMLPKEEESEEDPLSTTFLKALNAFGIDMEETCFWDVVRSRLETLPLCTPLERAQLRAGLQVLRQLFDSHDPRERLSLALDCLGHGDVDGPINPFRRGGHRRFGSIELEVDRYNFLGSIATQVLSFTTNELHGLVRVHYVGEKGQDAGGLTRDFFSSFANRLGEDEPLLWELTGRGSLQPVAAVAALSEKTWRRHSSGLSAADLYRACGRVFGIAVLRGCKLGRRLSKSFVRLLVNDERKDLASLQEEIRYEARDGEVDFRGSPAFFEKSLGDLGLNDTLTFTWPVRGRTDLRDVELVPGGARMTVTDANKTEWLELFLRQELVESFRPAAEAFQSGLIDVFGGSGDTCPLLCLLSAEDLIEVWGKGGVSREDVARWRAVTTVSPAIELQAKWFWQVLEEDFNDELRGKVLQFSTGSSSMGRDGLENFRLEPADGDDYRLPSAMTCGNMLQVPRYSCRHVLEDRLRFAAEDCSTFHMT